jgi:hypothetical protein
MGRSLLDAAQELASAPLVSEAAVQAFLCDVKLEEVEAVMGCSSTDERILLTALDRAFAVPAGQAALQASRDLLLAASSAQSVPLRRFCASQLMRLRALPGLETVGERELAALVADADTSVSSTSVAALAVTTVSDLSCLCPAAQHKDATVRLRLYDLAARLASKSPAAAAAVSAAGLLRGLLAELLSPDLLVALAGLETVATLAESPAAAAGLGDSALGVVPRLADLARTSVGDHLLRARAVLVCGRVAGALAASESPALLPLLDALASALTNDGAVQAAAVQAFGAIGATSAGSELAFHAPASVQELARVALTRGLTSELAQAAAHALATLAGAERPAAFLSDGSEAVLLSAVHDALAASRGAATLVEVVAATLRCKGPPFLEARVAAYRLTSALACRPWAASQFFTSATFLDELLGAFEDGHRACTWRHAAVCSLARAAGRLEGLRGAAARLGQPGASGPFGGNSAHGPQVAVALK